MISPRGKFRKTFAGTLTDTGLQPSIVSPRVVGLMRRAALSGAILTGAAASGLGYAHWESKQPLLRKYTAPIPGRPGFSGLRVLHISDIHMFPGQTFIRRFLQRISEREQIDLVISTGDNLANGTSLPDLMEAYQPLLKLPGAFVLGSNDYYSPLSKSWLSYLGRRKEEELSGHDRRDQPDLPWVELVTQLREAGWVDLSNRGDALKVAGTNVALIGVDDPHIRRDRIPTTPASWFDTDTVRLALTHSPYRRVLDPMSTEKADLICAGHTHGGQVCVPGVGALVTNSDLPRRYASGLHRWPPEAAPGAGSWLHVSAGLGTSPYAPVRFACRPEVSLIELVAE